MHNHHFRIPYFFVIKFFFFLYFWGISYLLDWHSVETFLRFFCLKLLHYQYAKNLLDMCFKFLLGVPYNPCQVAGALLNTWVKCSACSIFIIFCWYQFIMHLHPFLIRPKKMFALLAWKSWGSVGQSFFFFFFFLKSGHRRNAVSFMCVHSWACRVPELV